MTLHTDRGSSWLECFGRILTYSIRRALKEDKEGKKREFKDTSLWQGILKQMVGHLCNRRSIVAKDSCVMAIGNAIKDYIKTKVFEEWRFSGDLLSWKLKAIY
jgi:hypothetical protein